MRFFQKCVFYDKHEHKGIWKYYWLYKWVADRVCFVYANHFPDELYLYANKNFRNINKFIYISAQSNKIHCRL